MASKEEELKNFFTEEEKATYEELQKKLKAQRQKAVNRQKAEQKFWKEVSERSDEVIAYLKKNGLLNNPVQKSEQTPANTFAERINQQ